MEPKLSAQHIYECYCAATGRRKEFDIPWPPEKEICPVCGLEHGKGFMKCDFTLKPLKVFKTL